MTAPDRRLLLVAGLLGASGVLLAAAASHGSDARLLASASAIALAHAPVLLLLAFHAAHAAQAGALKIAGSAFVFGSVLFCGDLVIRAYFGNGLFAYAAPLGGLLLVAGWLTIAVAAILVRRDA